MDIPLGQCGHFNEVGLLKNRVFLNDDYNHYSSKMNFKHNKNLMHAYKIPLA